MNLDSGTNSAVVKINKKVKKKPARSLDETLKDVAKLMGAEARTPKDVMIDGVAAADICKIIEQCGRSGVSTLSYKGLEIKLGSERTSELPKTLPEIIQQPLILTDEQKEALEEAQNLQLAIDDPLAYEQQFIDGSIEEGTYEKNETRGSKQDIRRQRGTGS